MKDTHYLKLELDQLLGRDPAMLDFIQESCLDGLWSWDLEQPQHEWLSPSFWKVLGFDPATKQHCSSEWQDLIHPDDLKLATDNFQRHCADPMVPYDQYVRYRHQNGSTVWVRCRGVAIRNASGKPIRMLGTHVDVTALKRAEADLQTSNARLRQSMTELKSAQEKSIQQARLAALGQMASGIAHDFNNALMPIVGYSALLLAKPATLDNRTETLNMLEAILTAGNDARQIVRRLKQVFQKVKDTPYSLVNVADVVASAVELTKPRWREEMSAEGVDIRIVMDFQSTPEIDGDACELREALTNLIFNATDAMPKGGVITFRLFQERNATVVLEVVDTGNGMDRETLSQCVEPFFTTKGVEGSGLGLAMVQGIVNRHGGSLTLESRVGSGTTVRMRFPIPASVPQTPPPQEPDRKTIAPLRVLVIDDEERSRRLVSKLLKAEAHHVDVADGGELGIDLLTKKEFDLIITDRAMPMVRGDEVAHAAHTLCPDVAVIMLTGFGDIMMETGVFPVGVTRILTKPISPDDLKSAISELFGESERKDASGHQPNINA